MPLSSLMLYQLSHCAPKDIYIMGGSRGRDRGSGSTLKNHKIIAFLCNTVNTGPDPLKNHKATKPAFNVGPSLGHFNGVSLVGR